MGGCGLVGSLPSEIGQHMSLRNWAMNNNRLSGSIPSEVGKLTNLGNWRIHGNNLSGSIPSEVGHLTSLAHWNITRNQLSGSIPSEVGNMLTLAYWVTNDNFLSGPIPSEVGKLTNLRNWNVTCNLLSGSIPSQLGKLTKLAFWVADENWLSGTIPSQFGKLAQIAYWGMDTNLLSGTIPIEVGELTNLKHFDLASNRLSGTIPTQIGNLTNLKSCFLTNNTLHGPLPSQLAMLTALQRLDAAANRLSGSLPRLPPTLEYVTLHQNQIRGSIPSQIALLTSLKVLSLFDNRLTGSVPPLALPSTLLLLFNNLLSCSLPDRQIEQQNHSAPKTLVALGNIFSLDGLYGRIRARSWLHEWDADSTHLFEMYPRQWVRLVIMLLCCGLVASVLYWIADVPRAPPQRPIEMMVIRKNTDHEPEPELPSLLDLWRTCRRICLIMSIGSGAYIAALGFSEPMHECVDPVRRFTVAESRFSLSDAAFVGVVVCAAVHAVCSICGAVWMVRWWRSNSSTSQDWGGYCCAPILFVVWLGITSVIHLPVLVYLVSEAFPSNNVLGMDPRVVTVLRGLVSPWLVFSGEWLIPKLSIWMASWYDRRHRHSHRRRRQFLLRRHHDSTSFKSLVQQGLWWHSLSSDHDPETVIQTSTDLILVSQLVTMILAPVVSQLILHNRCLAYVTNRFWEPCQTIENSSPFNIGIQLETPFGMIPVPLLQQSDVCKSQFDPELCQRGVLASIATLSVSKVVIQTLFVLLRTLVLAVSNSIQISTSKSGPNHRGQRFRAWLINLLTPSEAAITRSIMALLILGVALGGAAPLIWPAVLVCVHATMWLWEFSGLHVAATSGLIARLLSVRVVWLGIGVQLGFAVWFVTANEWSQ
eukprot:c20757_g2_i2.p1 GENE.c20757_g2_i2~~c20757_g2_i2.p1  ORF type:complete len:871 (+),score=128.12 c20757_g2_i2:745-3357(+)